jgi:hypothetical protein
MLKGVVMHTAHSLEEASKYHLDTAISKRLAQNPIAIDVESVCFPVGLVFIRGDRKGPGEQLAQQVVGSYGYWNADSGEYIDLVFFGWGKDGDAPPIYDDKAFLHCKDQIERITKWRYTGETDVLLLNYKSPLARGYLREEGGHFSFDKVIWLPVERMIDSKRILSLDGLVQELINHAKDLRKEKGDADVWDISDRIGYQRARRALWKSFLKFVLRDFDEVWHELRPFAVCDLRP